MEALREKLNGIVEQVATMEQNELKNYRLIETIKCNEWRNGKEVEIEPRRNEMRIFYTDTAGLCYYRKGSSRRGYRYELRPAVLSLNLISKRRSPVDKKRQWEKALDKAIARLERSGLWTNVLKEMKTARAVGYDKLQAASKAYWQDEEGLSYEENKKRQAENVEKIDPRLMKTSAAKENKGEKYPDSGILFYWAHEIRVKKMNFGRYSNETNLAMIANAMKAKKDINLSGRTSYDVGFEYSHTKGEKAWYSEEFRGCGNGHYYLALDATHAIFYEDD